jgi:AcrR family transcriptional regulator
MRALSPSSHRNVTETFDFVKEGRLVTKKAVRHAGRPTREAAAQLDEQIRDAAVAAFIQGGFDGVTMEDVARGAGVGKPTLYARYPDKRALFASVVPWALQNLNWHDPVDDALAEDLEAALTAMAKAAHARAVDPRFVGLLRMAMAESPRFPEVAMNADELTRSPLVRSLVDLLERHGTQGAVTVEDPQTAAELFLGMVHLMPVTMAAFGFRRDPSTDDEHLQRVVTLFLNGVLRRDP